MRKPLIVIEAPGKIEKLRNLLSGLDIHNVHIEATKGRLYDLPIERIGINLDNFSINEFSPLNEKKLDYIKNHIEKSSHVLIMTDSDIEGEVIAYQISQLIPDTKPYYRLDIHSITTRGLSEALSKSRDIDPKKVIAGYSRRVFDRLVGYGCSTKNWATPTNEIKGNVGRILSPVLKSFHEENMTIGYLQKSVFKDGEEFLIDIELKRNNINDLDAIKSHFFSLSAPSLRETSSIVYDDLSCIEHGPALLSGLSESLEVSVLEAENIIQELYEDGDLSYPRTDSFYLSEDTIKEISALASHFDVKDFDPDVLREKAKNMSEKFPSQEAHEGIHSLSDRVSPFGILSSHDVKEQALILLMRNTFRSGQKNRKISVRSAEISPSSKNNDDWSVFLQKYGLSMVARRTATYIEGRKQIQPINNNFSPMGKPLSSLVSESRFRMIPKDLLVFNLMTRLGIGRPSTMAMHAAKISRAFISNDYSLNYKGIQSLNKTAMLANNLLSIDIARDIESILLSLSSNRNTNQRVSECLAKAGINLEEFKRGIELSIKTSSGEIKDESSFVY